MEFLHGQPPSFEDKLEQVEQMFSGEVPEHIVAQLKAEEAAGICEVLEENWATVMLWTRIGNLLNYGPMGGFIGLNWPAVLAKLSLLEKCEDLQVTPEMFEGLEIMESAALPILNESLDKN